MSVTFIRVPKEPLMEVTLKSVTMFGLVLMTHSKFVEIFLDEHNSFHLALEHMEKNSAI